MVPLQTFCAHLMPQSLHGTSASMTGFIFLVLGLGYMRAFPYERIMRDTRIMMIFEVIHALLYQSKTAKE